MRLRLMYKVGPELRFLGNLDTMRLIGRCVRRAGLPYALSEGFNPHIKMSLGTVLPVGVWSEGEWMDLELTERIPAGQVIDALNQAAPAGLVFVRGEYVDDSIPALMAMVDSARYVFRLENVKTDEAQAVLEEIMKEESLMVTSHGKGKDKVKDLARGLYGLDFVPREGDRGLITAWVASGSSFNIRPDEIADVIGRYLPEARIVDCYRQGNYIRRDECFVTPLGEAFSPEDSAPAGD